MGQLFSIEAADYGFFRKSVFADQGRNIRNLSQLMINTGSQNGSHTYLFSVQGIRVKIKGGRPHFDQMGNVMLAAGGRPGVAHELHRQTGQDERIGELLKGLRVSCLQAAAAGIHRFHRLTGHFLDDGTEIFPRERMGDLPVRQRRILAENITGSAERQIERRFFNNIGIGQDEHGSHAGHGFLIALPGHRRYGGAETVHAGCGGAGNKGNTELVCAVSRGVMDGAASHGDQIVNSALQPFPEHADGDFIGMQIFRGQDDLLSCLRADEIFGLIRIFVIYHGTLAGKTVFCCIKIQLLHAAGFDDGLSGYHYMFPAAGAGAIESGTVDNHDFFLHFETL